MTFNQSAGGLADFEGGLSSYLKTGTGNLGSLTINDAIVGSQGDVYFDALNGDSGGVFRNNGAGTMYLGVNGGSGTFLGMILDGSGQALVKLGAGTQVLSGTDTYTGGTTVLDGTLVLTFRHRAARRVEPDRRRQRKFDLCRVGRPACRVIRSGGLGSARAGNAGTLGRWRAGGRSCRLATEEKDLNPL